MDARSYPTKTLEAIDPHRVFAPLPPSKLDLVTERKKEFRAQLQRVIRLMDNVDRAKRQRATLERDYQRVRSDQARTAIEIGAMPLLMHIQDLEAELMEEEIKARSLKRQVIELSAQLGIEL